jgi:predicted metal-dependent hydrolase
MSHDGHDPASTGSRRAASSRVAPEPATVQQVMQVNGTALPYVLRISARARLIRLVIRPETGLEVVAPRGTPQSRVDHVLAEKVRWIVSTLDRMARETASVASRSWLADGARLSFAGREIHLVLREGAPSGRYRASLVGETLTLHVAEMSQECIRHALEAWYRRQASGVFAERLATCNAAYGFVYGRVAIKEQKSRWGSCSRKGNLNFNWRLLLAPLPVLDYVVTHELCHLRELNHSPRFWSLVARGCPDYAVQRRWLRDHGRGLQL